MAEPVFCPRLMKVVGAAHYLGISPSKLRTLGLPCRRSGANVLYDRADLDAWADSLPYDRDQGAPSETNGATHFINSEESRNACDEAFGM